MISFILKMTAYVNKAKDKAKVKQLEAYKKLQKREKLKAFKKGEVKTELDGLSDKKGKGMKKLQKEVNDNKLKSMLLLTLSYIIGFFESLPIYITIFLSVLALVIVIGVIVMIISMIVALQSLVSGEANKVPQIKPPSENIENQLGGSGAEWTLEELAQRGGLLTDYEKNLYRLIMLYKEHVSYNKMLYPKDTGDLMTSVTFATGLFAIESSAEFYANNKNVHNILEVPTDKRGINSSGYTGNFQVSASTSLGDWYNDEANKYAKVYIQELKNKYKPTVDASIPRLDLYYIPYSSAISVAEAHHKIAEQSIASDRTVKEAYRLMDVFGVKEKRDELLNYLIWALAQAEYHGADEVEYTSYMAFWIAMYVSTSDVDSERDMSKWGSNSSSYSASPTRKMVLGNKNFMFMDHYNTPVDIKYTGSDGYLTLNGTPINKSLWEFLWEKYSDVPDFAKAWKLTVELASIHDNSQKADGRCARVLNFVYGMNSYLQGTRIMEKVTGKLTGTPSGGTNVIAGEFKETPGKGQGNWGGKTAETVVSDYVAKNTGMKSYMDSLIATFGTANNTKQGEKVAGDVWKPAKFAVPFYGQGNRYGETYNNLKWYPNTETYGVSGCMVYAHAYAASAISGLLINPAEMGAIMITKGALGSGGISSGEMPKVYSLLGLQSKVLPDFNGSNWSSNWSQVDECLDKNGVAVVRATGEPYASGENHFIVITGKTLDSSGKKMYSMYTSTNVPQTNSLHSEATLKANLHRGVVLVWK